MAFVRAQLIAVRSEADGFMQITPVISCALTLRASMLQGGSGYFHQSWPARSHNDESNIKEITDMPPNVDIPSSLKEHMIFMPLH